MLSWREYDFLNDCHLVSSLETEALNSSMKFSYRPSESLGFVAAIVILNQLDFNLLICKEECPLLNVKDTVVVVGCFCNA